MKYRDFNNYEIYPYEDKVVNIQSGKTLKQYENDRGYKFYRLYKNGEVYCIRTNRLYYETLHGDIPQGMEIDHLNNNRGDNNPDNLRLVTHTENMNNPITKENRKKIFNTEEYKKKRSEIMKGKLVGVKNPMYGKPRPEGASVPPKSIRVFRNGTLVKQYDCINDAIRELKLSRGNVYFCLYGIRKQTKGYTFEFV